MKIAVLANGEWDPQWGKKELSDCTFLVCADGGANLAISSGHLPQAVIGDLDSITPENLEKCRANGVIIECYPREKDETDLELALQYVAAQLPSSSFTAPQELWLYGAIGGRIDHFLGNLALMLEYIKKGIRIRLKDPRHEMWILHGREYIRGFKGQELSLIVLSEQAVITTEGLYYPLNHDTLKQDSPRGISNVFLGEEAVVHVHHGYVLLVLLNSSL